MLNRVRRLSTRRIGSQVPGLHLLKGYYPCILMNPIQVGGVSDISGVGVLSLSHYRWRGLGGGGDRTPTDLVDGCVYRVGVDSNRRMILGVGWCDGVGCIPHSIYKHSPTNTPLPAHLTLYRTSTHLNLSVPLGSLLLTRAPRLLTTVARLIRIATLDGDRMNESERAELDEAMEYIRNMTRLSMDIAAAKSGDEAALQRVADRGKVCGEFPGSKQRAMGHALVYVEDLEELGLSAERQYHGLSEDSEPLESEATSLHRIDIVISDESGDSQ